LPASRHSGSRCAALSRYPIRVLSIPRPMPYYSIFFEFGITVIGRCGPYPKASSACQACSGNFTTTEKVVNQLSDRGMDHTSIINFLSNEDTG
jgi:hypothetical protein